MKRAKASNLYVMHYDAACDPFCTTCNTNGAAKCDGQAFCSSTTYYDTNSKTCKGKCTTTTVIVVIGDPIRDGSP